MTKDSETPPNPRSPIDSAVFDLIEGTATHLAGPDFPWHPSDLRLALRETVVDLEVVYDLVSDPLDDDPIVEAQPALLAGPPIRTDRTCPR